MSETVSSVHAPAEDDVADVLRDIAKRVRWIATSIVDAANRGRPNTSGVKVGGHQASSASMVDIMVSLWFSELTNIDRVSVKPHASPVLHAINYLLGDLDVKYLPSLRAKGGLQSYPSRLKDPDTVDFSTGSVGIGATAALWAAMSHRYIASRFPTTPSAGRFVSLLGDAELDEGAIWEAVADPSVAQLGELLWIVDLNRQSLDRVVPDVQIHRLMGMFAAAGWQVITLKWGRVITELFTRPGGDDLRQRLEAMSNEEYQRLLRVDSGEIAERIIGPSESAALRALLESLPPADLAAALRDLGGHDIDLLLETYRMVDTERPTVIFAYTVKGRGLPTEGHPNNHSALLSGDQMRELANVCGTDIDVPWASFPDGSATAKLCAERSAAMVRPPVIPQLTGAIPLSLARPHKAPISTQASLGRFLADLKRAAPEIADRVVTCSPDVASSTNLGGWINKTGVWSVQNRLDWFADDAQRVLKWSEVTNGQHIELGIAEVNLVGLLGELGATWSRWGERLIPIATLYDPFISRALEPWSYGIYSGGQSIIIGTPSGVTLAPEGGAHQSVTTPSIGLEQPQCIAWEPAFAQDLEWCMLAAMSRVGIEGGTSSYFRLSTRPIDQALAAVPQDDVMQERRRQQAVAGGYRITEHDPSIEQVTLVGVGAIMPEVIAAAEMLAEQGITAGVVCLTSPDLVFRSFDQRGTVGTMQEGDIINALFPTSSAAPIVTVMDGHPHTLSFLAGARGDRIRCLGVSDFGQSSSLADAYELHGIDTRSIVDAATTLVQGAPSSSVPTLPQQTSPEAAAPMSSALRGTTQNLTRLRKTIAKRMVESLQTSAQLTTIVEVDVTEIGVLRRRHNSELTPGNGVRLSYLPFIAVAALKALRVYPQLNSAVDLEAGTITYPDAEHLGVAVDTDKGLFVPVIRDAGSLSVAELAARIADVADRTRNNTIGVAELSGGTFTITNTGSRGALLDTPIINQPQVAILGAGVVTRRPVILGRESDSESIAIRSMVYLSLTYDHRVVDGADAARYLSEVKADLERVAFAAGSGT